MIRQSKSHIYLPGQEPLERKSLEDFFSRLRNSSNPHLGLTKRSNPNCIEDMATLNRESPIFDAVLRTLFANPDTMGLTYFGDLHGNYSNSGVDPSYGSKVAVFDRLLTRLGERFNDKSNFYKAGDVYQSQNLFKRDTTPSFWSSHFREYGEGGYEALFDQRAEETSFLFGSLRERVSSKIDPSFEELRKRHEQEDLFSDGPVNFVIHGAKGIYLPVFDVTELIGVSSSGRDYIDKLAFAVQRLKPGGVCEAEIYTADEFRAEFNTDLSSELFERMPLLQPKQEYVSEVVGCSW